MKYEVKKDMDPKASVISHKPTERIIATNIISLS